MNRDEEIIMIRNKQNAKKKSLPKTIWEGLLATAIISGLYWLYYLAEAYFRLKK